MPVSSLDNGINIYELLNINIFFRRPSFLYYPKGNIKDIQDVFELPPVDWGWYKWQRCIVKVE